jgi:anti-sigma factor RsiW
VSGHLGNQVAAFVDGQLDYSRREKALEHLAGCARCRAAVERQRWVKLRVQTLPSAEPSADLLSSLTRVSAAQPSFYPQASGHWLRGRTRLLPGGRVWRGGLLLAGAGSLAAGFIGVAYAVGGVYTEQSPVSPPVGRFSAQFAGSGPMPFTDPATDVFPALRSRSPVGER